MIIQTRRKYFLIREKAEDEMHVRKKKKDDMVIDLTGISSRGVE